MHSTRRMLLSFDPQSPERGWQPFLDWLTTAGLNPSDVRDVTFDPSTLSGTATVFKRRAGQHYVEDGDIASKTVRFQAPTLPPTRS